MGLFSRRGEVHNLSYESLFHFGFSECLFDGG
jgi:hypothetical protein